MYDELIKRLRDMARSDGNIKSNYIGLSLLQAADAIEELTDTNVGKWIPVTERLPNKSEDALFFSEWTGASGCIYQEIRLATLAELEYQGYRAIAWMPLPEPPKEEEA